MPLDVKHSSPLSDGGGYEEIAKEQSDLSAETASSVDRAQDSQRQCSEVCVFSGYAIQANEMLNIVPVGCA